MTDHSSNLNSAFPTIPDGDFKKFIYEQIARIGKALSSKQRLVILNILSQGNHTVEEIAKFSQLTVSNVSRHLSVLQSVNFVSSHREGKYKYYVVSNRRVTAFYNDLKNIAWDQLAEIQMTMQNIAKSSTRIDSVSREELHRLMNSDEAVLLDVRPRSDYLQARIPKSISIPLPELEDKVDELPKDKQIVVYCRGSYCVLADEALKILRTKGLAARRTDENIVDRDLDGLPLEGIGDV